MQKLPGQQRQLYQWRAPASAATVSVCSRCGAITSEHVAATPQVEVLCSGEDDDEEVEEASILGTLPHVN